MLTEREYIFFCDESDRKGPYYSNFYGGVRVAASHLNPVNTVLLARKQSLGLTSEVKWEKTDATNVERYEQMMAAFFHEVANRSLAVRVMFTQNIHVARGLSERQVEDAYYILYYQFHKHAFGLRHLPPHAHPPGCAFTWMRWATRGRRSCSSGVMSPAWPRTITFVRTA